MENYGRKEPVPGYYTIDILCPKRRAILLVAECLGPIGGDSAKMVPYCNLTLTGYNSEYGDLSFPKTDTEGGFGKSTMSNRGLARLELGQKSR